MILLSGIPARLGQLPQLIGGGQHLLPGYNAELVRAEQDALYAWQIPLGSQNPTLVILAPDGSEARLPIGPLPPP